MKRIHWTTYLLYRLNLRGFDQAKAESVLRFTSERYQDTVTGRLVAVGKHGKGLVLIPYEIEGDTITPVTIHAISRQQIKTRIASRRFRNV